MSVNTIRDSQSGVFATSRRGGLTGDEIKIARALKAKGRSNQHIADYFGRSTMDIYVLFAPIEAPAIEALPPLPAAQVRASARAKMFSQAELAILQRVDNGQQSARSAVREIGCSITTVRNWIANNRMRRDIRPSRYRDEAAA